MTEGDNDMATVKTVSIDTAEAKKAIKKEATAATLTLTASGSDKWTTAGSGHQSVQRSFSVTVSYPAGKGDA